MTDPLDAFPAFVDAVRARLELGRVTYGDRSFAQPAPATLLELEQEALDMAGWGFVLYTRLRALRDAVTAAEVDVAHRLMCAPRRRVVEVTG